MVAGFGNPCLGVERMLQPAPQRHARGGVQVGQQPVLPRVPKLRRGPGDVGAGEQVEQVQALAVGDARSEAMDDLRIADVLFLRGHRHQQVRSEEHTSELQSLMRISYAVFCLKKKTNNTNKQTDIYTHK